MGHDEDTNDTFDNFESHLKETLANFYNPLYSPSEQMWLVLGRERNQGIEGVWTEILNCIEELKPAADTPSQARGWRIYKLLSLRYVKQLTQEKTAEEMGITARHLRREQQNAVRLLARKLWDKNLQRNRSGSVAFTSSSEVTPTESHDSAWRSQLQQELESLNQSTPGAVSNIGEKLTRALELSQGIMKSHQIILPMQPNLSGILVEVHPSILSQILLQSIEALSRLVIGGTLSIRPEQIGNHIILHLQIQDTVAIRLEIPDITRELAKLEGLSIQSIVNQTGAGIDLELPVAHERTVLVVDDNLDLVHFYQRYTTNTRFRIVHLQENQEIFELIAQIEPDIIVLDVMLPDIDGWEVLTRLMQTPITRSIPIIVCSVTQGKELAASLGATEYVPKPVGRREFLEALERVSRVT